MDALAARLADEFPSLNRGRGITVVGGGQVRVPPEIDGALVSAAGLLLVIVGLVLVLACANLANLLIVRGIFRGPEMALRRALGASRGRVARLFLTESILLALLGGGLGMLLGWWALRLIPLVANSVTATFGGTGNLDIPMDLTVLAYTVTLSPSSAVFGGIRRRPDPLFCWGNHRLRFPPTSRNHADFRSVGRHFGCQSSRGDALQIGAVCG